MRSDDSSFPNFSLSSIKYNQQSLLRSIGRWFLLRGKRTSVTLFVLVCVLLTLLFLSIPGTGLEMRQLLAETTTVQTMFNTLLGGIIRLVAIVVSINAIVLSQEITNLQDQRDHIDASIQYRNRIDEFVDSDVSPTRPAKFLHAILSVISKQSAMLAKIAEDSENKEFSKQMRQFTSQVTADAERAGRTLSNTELGTFHVLLSGLDYDYSRQLHTAHRLKRQYNSQLGENGVKIMDNFIETLTFFAIGREYFKSLFYERELGRLSKRLLYVSLPAIVFTSYVLLALDAKLFPREMALPLLYMYGITPTSLFISLAYTVALAPFVIFTTYIIRAVTVTINTLAAGPFILDRGATVQKFDLDSSEETWEVAEMDKSPTED
jgi:hypothetical protein